jgi:hypothetical protein
MDVEKLQFWHGFLCSIFDVEKLQFWHSFCAAYSALYTLCLSTGADLGEQKVKETVAHALESQDGFPQRMAWTMKVLGVRKIVRSN